MSVALEDSWEGVMRKHAKSFYLASLFFPKALMPRVKALYALCRWLDDAVDEAPNSMEASKNLKIIADDLRKPVPEMPVNRLYKSNQLDSAYIEDLIEGAREDMKTVRIKDEAELIQYCYKVAGTVGLAMFDLLKVDSPLARPHAVDLGIGMQITNICRDVKEDLERNRVYIPQTLLYKHGLSAEKLLNDSYDSQALSRVVEELLSLADLYYQSAQSAYRSIPWRARGAIIIASRLYQGIGLKLRDQGSNPMCGRTYLTKREKLVCLFRGAGEWLLSSVRKRVQLQHNPTLHHSLKAWSSQRGFEV
jgi:phytoene synthase